MKTQTTPPATKYKYLYHGKVRDTMKIPGGRLAIVASDRISAFDHIIPTGIPGKGIILTQLSNWWTEQLKDIAPTHLLKPLDKNMDFLMFPKLWSAADSLRGRTVVVNEVKILPIEWIVRGNITGTGWADYQKTGSVGGHKLPANLKRSERLPEPILTPSTKAEQGLHDENITCEQAKQTLFDLGYDSQVYGKCEEYSLKMFSKARDIAAYKGIILADTKFELGLDKKGNVVVADEILTPDSSRYWGMENYEVAFKEGVDPDSFDKQFVRNYLTAEAEKGKWDKKKGPAPELPEAIVYRTLDKYLACYERLAGKDNQLINGLRGELARVGW